MSKKALPFEKSLSELNQIVEEMERGELSLEQSLKHFEKGVALTRNCQSALKEAEQKVQILNDRSELETYQDDSDE